MVYFLVFILVQIRAQSSCHLDKPLFVLVLDLEVYSKDLRRENTYNLDFIKARKHINLMNKFGVHCSMWW